MRYESMYTRLCIYMYKLAAFSLPVIIRFMFDYYANCYVTKHSTRTTLRRPDVYREGVAKSIRMGGDVGSIVCVFRRRRPARVTLHQ